MAANRKDNDNKHDAFLPEYQKSGSLIACRVSLDHRPTLIECAAHSSMPSSSTTSSWEPSPPAAVSCSRFLFFLASTSLNTAMSAGPAESMRRSASSTESQRPAMHLPTMQANDSNDPMPCRLLQQHTMTIHTRPIWIHELPIWPLLPSIGVAIDWGKLEGCRLLAFREIM